MNNTYRVSLLLLCVSVLPVWGTVDGNVFSDELMDNYDKAVGLNIEKNYLQAYRQISDVVRELDNTLFDKHVSAYNLMHDDFFFYWPVKKSCAEIAYKLGNYKMMGTIAKELTTIVEKRDWTEDGTDWKISCMADVAKINGSMFFLTEQYDSSRIALQKALQLKPMSHDFTPQVRADLAQVYYVQGEFLSALSQIDTILTSPPYSPNYRNPVSEEDRMERLSWRAMCLARLHKFDEALNCIEKVVAFSTRSTDLQGQAESLRKKAKILMLQYDQTGKLSPVARQCYEQYLKLSRNYIDKHFVNLNESEREQYWMAERPFVTDCYRLEGLAPDLLYDVALYSKAVLLQIGRVFKPSMTESQKKDALAAIHVNWQRVKAKLPSSSAAIEFVCYDNKGEERMAALVLKNNSSKPEYIDIARIADIYNFKLNNGSLVKDVLNNTNNKDHINALYWDKKLDSLIWNSQLIKILSDVKNVYFAADGIFHQIAVEYKLPDALKAKHFYRLTSTRLLAENNKKLRTDSMLICGNVSYRTTNIDNSVGNDELAYSLLAGTRLPDLPGSQIEIDSIQSLRGFKPSDYILSADSLTETALKKMLNKYRIVHISTHGYFTAYADKGMDLEPASTDTQLSTSCLFLSGAEKNLTDTKFNASYHDGVLSARELAQIDMSNVDLTVLSACMSGLGFITPDGVYGLQRGLKTAGVKAIVTSLWSVDDQASSLLMRQLYKNMESGMSILQAFNQARDYLISLDENVETVKDEITGSYMERRTKSRFHSFNKPCYYDAFILIDGIE